MITLWHINTIKVCLLGDGIEGQIHTTGRIESSEDAISSWGSTVTCIACRLEEGKFKIYCPYGLDDLFNLVIRPVKRYFVKEQYEERAARWKNKWDKLTIVEWNE